MQEQNNIKLNTRDDLPSYLKEIGLNGIGAEIGVQRGIFSEQLIKGAEFNKFYSIDFWGDITPDTFNEDGTNYIRHNSDPLYEETINRLKPYGDTSVVIKSTSIQASVTFKDEYFDFVYLDADHSLQGVKDDIAHWYPKVKRGGMLAGHDYLDATLVWEKGIHSEFGVKTAVDEFCKQYNLELHIIKEIEEEPWHTWYIFKP
jgi:hypothetical protein